MFGLGFSDTSSGSSRPTDDSDHSADEASAALVSLLPWGVSILFHVGLVLIAIFVIWSTIKQPQENDRLIEVESSIIQEEPQLDALPSDDANPLADSTTPNPRVPPRPVDRPSTVLDTTIGAEGAVALGDVFEDGGADKPGPFDMTTPGGGTDGVNFIVKDSAKRIAFVIDASGSLLDSMPFVITNLKKAIGALGPHQSFTVIFSQSDKAIEVPPQGMHSADTDHKKQALDWIDMGSGNVVPQGRSQPIVAIKTALRYKPEVIFLLSDNITGHGQFETDQKQLLADVIKANKAKARINTIQFLYPDPLISVGLKPTLEVISSATGGKYKFIDGHELGIHW